MFTSSFSKQIYLVLFGVALIASYPLAVFGTPEVIRAVIAGSVLSTLNVLAGNYAIEYSFHRSHTTFLKFVLGGMGLRMFLMLAILAMLISVFDFHVLALVISMLFFYGIYLALEVMHIQKKVSLTNKS